jgi:hypothetical protein
VRGVAATSYAPLYTRRTPLIAGNGVANATTGIPSAAERVRLETAGCPATAEARCGYRCEILVPSSFGLGGSTARTSPLLSSSTTASNPNASFTAWKAVELGGMPPSCTVAVTCSFRSSSATYVATKRDAISARTWNVACSSLRPCACAAVSAMAIPATATTATAATPARPARKRRIAGLSTLCVSHRSPGAIASVTVTGGSSCAIAYTLRHPSRDRV